MLKKRECHSFEAIWPYVTGTMTHTVDCFGFVFSLYFFFKTFASQFWRYSSIIYNVYTRGSASHLRRLYIILTFLLFYLVLNHTPFIRNRDIGMYLNKWTLFYLHFISSIIPAVKPLETYYLPNFLSQVTLALFRFEEIVTIFIYLKNPL